MIDASIADVAKALFAELSAAPFPILGKDLGDFPLFDGIVAGALSSAAQDAPWSIPYPDAESRELAESLRRRRYSDLSDDERAFLKYWNLLERICNFLASCEKSKPGSNRD